MVEYFVLGLVKTIRRIDQINREGEGKRGNIIDKLRNLTMETQRNLTCFALIIIVLSFPATPFRFDGSCIVNQVDNGQKCFFSLPPPVISQYGGRVMCVS